MQFSRNSNIIRSFRAYLPHFYRMMDEMITLVAFVYDFVRTYCINRARHQHKNKTVVLFIYIWKFRGSGEVKELARQRLSLWRCARGNWCAVFRKFWCSDPSFRFLLPSRAFILVLWWRYFRNANTTFLVRVRDLREDFRASSCWVRGEADASEELKTFT